MAIKRIICDIASPDVAGVAKFYMTLFDLDIAMDQTWIKTLTTGTQGPVQISIASEGGSGTPVPDMSIEVDDVDATHTRAREMGCKITYELTDEPWGVRRFFLRDPAGKLLNILSHSE
jgi:predicted enzyme related to lactoylglutathione lyase